MESKLITDAIRALQEESPAENFNRILYISERQSQDPIFMDAVEKMFPGVEIVVTPHIKPTQEE